MKNYLASNFLTLSVGFFISTGVSLGQSFEWAVSSGGLKSDKGTTIVVDDAGNSYITGYYNEQATFGSITTPFSFANSKEVYVAKIDPQGNFIWVKNGTNYYDDRGLGICLDPMGNVYVTGTCWGGLSFGSLYVYNSTAYTDQIFVLKLDNNGNEIWLKNAGVDEGGYPYNDDHGLDLASDSQGNIYVTGFLSNADFVDYFANFDAIQIPMLAGDTLAFLGKLSNDGNWQWVETFQGIYNHRDNAIGIDDEDNIYVTGGFVGTKTFGTSTITSTGNQDIYVAKYDPAGNFIYVSQAGGLKKDRGDAITYGNDNHMYITGEFRDISTFGTIALDNYGGSSGGDIFVAKMTKSGEWVWASKAGSKKGSDRGTGICANDQGNIFVSGQYSGDASFGVEPISSLGDSIQAFVAAIDTLGVWRWVLGGGGPEADRAASVATDSACNVYITGYFKFSMQLDGLSLTSVGGYDIFTAKITDGCFGYTPPEDPNEEVPTEGTCEIDSSNVFSPNGDGINDYLIFSELCNIKSHIVIVNRWGNVVFETTDILVPWDGKDKSGIPVSEGVYFYKIELENDLGTKELKTGFITLMK